MAKHHSGDILKKFLKWKEATGGTSEPNIIEGLFEKLLDREKPVVGTSNSNNTEGYI